MNARSTIHEMHWATIWAPFPTGRGERAMQRGAAARWLCWIPLLLALVAGGALADTVTFTLTLNPGLNRVSIPVALPDTANSPAVVFAPILGQVQTIRAFDATRQTWQDYVPNADEVVNTLKHIRGGAALWVTMKDTTHSGTALQLLGTGEASPAVGTGWSAFGVGKKDTPRTLATALRYDPAADSILSIDAQGSWQIVRNDDELQPGRYYWIDNDPDDDGVASVDEATYGGRPLMADLRRDANGQVVSTTPPATAATKTSQELTDLQSTCGLAETDPARIAAALTACQNHREKTQDRYDDRKDAYPLGNNADVTMGSFRFTSVRYTNDKTEGIALLEHANMPADLQKLLAFQGGQVLFTLDMRNGVAIGAYAESVTEDPVGLVLGPKGDALSLDATHNTASIDYVAVSQAGALEIELSAKLDDRRFSTVAIPKQPWFVQWTPAAQLAKLTLQGMAVPGNYLRLGHLLGEDGASANLVWQGEGLRRTEKIGATDYPWLINLPHAARGMMEPFVNGRARRNSHDPADWLPVAMVDAAKLDFKVTDLNSVCLLTGLALGICTDKLKQTSFNTVTVNANGTMNSESDDNDLGRIQVIQGWLAMGDKLGIFQFRARNGSVVPQLKPYYHINHTALSWRPSFALRLGVDEHGMWREASVEIGLAANLVLDLLNKRTGVGIFDVVQRCKGILTADNPNPFGVDNLTLRADARLALAGQGNDNIDLSASAAGSLVNSIDKLQGSTDFLQTLRSSLRFQAGVGAFDLSGRALSIAQKQGTLSALALKHPLGGTNGQQFYKLDALFNVNLPDETLFGGKDLSFEATLLGKPIGDGVWRKRGVLRAGLRTAATERDADDWDFEIVDLSGEFTREVTLPRPAVTTPEPDMMTEGMELLDVGKRAFLPTSAPAPASPTATTPEDSWRFDRFSGIVKLTPPSDWSLGGPYEAYATAVQRTNEGSTPYLRWTFEFPLNFVAADNDWGVTFKNAMLVFSKPNQGDWALYAEAEINLGDAERNIPVTLSYDRATREWFVLGKFNFTADNLGEFELYGRLRKQQKDANGNVVLDKRLTAGFEYSVQPSTVEDWLGVRPNAAMAAGCDFTGNLLVREDRRSFTCHIANIPLGNRLDTGPFAMTAIRDVILTYTGGNVSAVSFAADTKIPFADNTASDPFVVTVSAVKNAEQKWVWTLSGDNLMIGLGDDIGKLILPNLSFSWVKGATAYAFNTTLSYLPSQTAKNNTQSSTGIGLSDSIVASLGITRQAVSVTFDLGAPAFNFAGNSNSIQLRQLTITKRR